MSRYQHRHHCLQVRSEKRVKILQNTLCIKLYTLGTYCINISQLHSFSEKMCFHFSSFVFVLHSVYLNCLTPADPFSIMDINDSPHQVTSSLSPLPEDIQSLPCMFLCNSKYYILKMFLVKRNFIIYVYFHLSTTDISHSQI